MSDILLFAYRSAISSTHAGVDEGKHPLVARCLKEQQYFFLGTSALKRATPLLPQYSGTRSSGST